MAKIIDELTKANWRGLYHFRYGYEEAPIVTMLFYDLSSLNSSDVDFKGAKVKHAKYEKTRFGDAKKITWYEDSIKEQGFQVTADVTATWAGVNATLTVASGLDLKKWDVIRDIETQETMLVTAVAGTSVTVAELLNNVTAATDHFLIVGFAKTYGEYSARAKDFNDYIAYDNYIQFCSAEIPEDKTDILTNNLDRLFYPTVKDYLKELYAEASRTIIKTIVYSFYCGVAQKVTVSGKDIFTAWGLEFYIPVSAMDQNIKGATAKATIRNFQDQVVAAYKSWVSGLNRGNRLMMFVNYAMSAQITDDFLSISNLNINDNTTLNKFGINMKEFNLNGYKITLVEDPTLDTLYGDAKVWFIVDLEGISLINLVEGVISDNGKTADALWASIIRVKPQDTYEMKTVSLNTHFSWVFKNISSGCFRKLIYV